MNNLNEYNVEEIQKTECVEITGGADSWLFKLGASAHRAWCSLRDSAIKHQPGYIHSQYGI